MQISNKDKINLATKLISDYISNTFTQLSNITVIHENSNSRVTPQLQVFFNHKFGLLLEDIIYELMLTHALKSELVVPRTFQKCLFKIVQGLNSNIDFKKNKEIIAKIPTMSNVVSSIREIFSTDEQLMSFLLEAFTLAGFNGKFLVEKSILNKESMELIDGYEFSVISQEIRRIRHLKPKILCLDAIVENVSEIHSILEGAGERREPVLIIARGFSNDVLHTINVNVVQGRLSVVPIIMKYDEVGANALVDIAVISGCDVVSTLKGQLLSSLTIDDCVEIDSAIVENSTLTLLNRSTNDSVKRHILDLKNRRDQKNDEFTRDVFNTRLKSLSSRQVVLRLRDDMSFVKKSQLIDYALRTFRCLIEQGVDDFGEPSMLTSIIDSYASQCVDLIRNCGAIIFY